MELGLPTISNHEMCRDCGACCMGMMAPPTIDDPADDEWYDSLPPVLREELDAHEMQIGDPCFWFDTSTRRCKHYEHRPPTCRTFEPGCDVCHEDRAIYLGLTEDRTDASERG